MCYICSGLIEQCLCAYHIINETLFIVIANAKWFPFLHSTFSLWRQNAYTTARTVCHVATRCCTLPVRVAWTENARHGFSMLCAQCASPNINAHRIARRATHKCPHKTHARESSYRPTSNIHVSLCVSARLCVCVCAHCKTFAPIRVGHCAKRAAGATKAHK